MRRILILAGMIISGFASLACRSTPQPTPTTPRSFEQANNAEALAIAPVGPAQATKTNGTATAVSQTIQASPGATYLGSTYCTPGGIPLTMNVFYPKVIGDNPIPVAVYIHGGYWRGDKNDVVIGPIMPEMLARGYIVASLDYRSEPPSMWPVEITDVKCAIRHLRANAAAYKLDSTKIGVWGGSAGGHLAAMLGTTDQSQGFDVGEYADESSRVQAVVDLFGPTDLSMMPTVGEGLGLLQTVFGATSLDDPILLQASPVTYISPDDPPFLIMHGDKDTTVPMEQSQILYDKLTAGQVNATFIIVKNAGHSFASVGGPVNPSYSEIAGMIGDFFDKYLK